MFSILGSYLKKYIGYGVRYQLKYMICIIIVSVVLIIFAIMIILAGTLEEDRSIVIETAANDAMCGRQLSSNSVMLLELDYYLNQYQVNSVV